MPERTLLLFDGPCILRPHYEAIKGEDTPERVSRAFRTAKAAFLRELDKHAPTHALAAFDFGGTTWRHDIYPRYREDRKPMAEILRAALPDFLAELNEVGLATAYVPGVEAEDVIATVFTKWSEHMIGQPVTVVANDKDIYGLIAEGAHVWSHRESTWRTREWVREKFGVPVELMEDWLALVGDATDSVPGVSNVGYKTAARLLLEHGGFMEVLDAAPDIHTAAGKSLQVERDIALVSRQLVTLKRDVHVGVTATMLRYTPNIQRQAA